MTHVDVEFTFFFCLGMLGVAQLGSRGSGLSLVGLLRSTLSHRVEKCGGVTSIAARIQSARTGGGPILMTPRRRANCSLFRFPFEELQMGAGLQQRRLRGCATLEDFFF